MSQTLDIQTQQTHNGVEHGMDGHGVEVLPHDEHNTKLVANVHPPEWKNPTPSGTYNMVVIGAGTGGLVTAVIAASLGAKVALVEKHLMGGDCLNVGCVPSKAIIRSARAMHEIQHASNFGLRVPEGTEIVFGSVMERMRQIRARISEVDSARRYTEEGVDVYLGQGRFTGPDTLEVGGQTLRFKKAVIATGARAAEPPIPGLKEAGFLTNETVFTLTERPQRLAVIGGGPIGAELAQAFQRLGSEVTLLHNRSHILEREDADAAEIVQQQLLQDGVRLVLDVKINEVTLRDGTKVLRYEQPDGSGEVAVDEILVGAGRVPNVDTLDLEAAGVEYDRKGLKVDDNLRTTNPNIYGVGDVAVPYKFTHAADATARIVARNALFKGRGKASTLTMPWVTYTEPEIAHVGLYEHEAKERGIEVDTFVAHLGDVDRAIADGEDEGFVKVHVKKGSDKIVGATIVAHHAGEMISEITLAMVGNVGLSTINDVIHPYPTQAEAIRKVAGLYMRTKLTPTVKKLFNWWLRFTR
jgi:pyruvate/2-oxoglutarate dehydrogenase complex dihydrolipoamide dehydrogenase (E3) component